MKGALHVLSPGFMTTVQDLGRPGFQRLGIPVGGALDPVALRAANALVGNPAETGGLEIAYAGPTLAVDAESVRLAFAGARASIEVLSPGSAERKREIPMLQSAVLRGGEILRIGSLAGGSVLYLAIEGGFEIAPVLGSVSTFMRGGFGGLDGRALQTGDALPLCQAASRRGMERKLGRLDLMPASRVRAIVGPQANYFTEEEISAFFESEYVVGHGSDRMGMRLSGRAIRHRGGFDITSDAIAPGSIQIAGDGQPIALLVDRQTTGGYPKIATVISADLPALGRVPIGARIRFERSTQAAAEQLRREFMAEIGNIESRIVPSGLRNKQPSELHGLNLISGVVDARSDFMRELSL
jgi:biotin-dependent carboxylase-like uncharacterized protein